jgi:hypothetical protein
MTGIFEKVYDEEWMMYKGKAHRKRSLVYQEPDSKAKEAEKQKYIQKVKEYTSYKIGRKISENTPHFS